MLVIVIRLVSRAKVYLVSISFIATLVAFIECAFYAGLEPHMVWSVDLGLGFTDVNKIWLSQVNPALCIAPLGGYFPTIKQDTM